MDRLKQQVKGEEMKKRSLWLLGGGLVALLTVGFFGQTALATMGLGLSTDQPCFIQGQPAELTVDVDPMYIGYHAELWATVEETGEHVMVMPFMFSSPHFTIMAPTIGQLGMTLNYRYQAFSPEGFPAGTSNRVGRQYLPPDWDE